MKVAHIVESLDRGAVEAWLVRMLRHAAARGIALDWTFYCTIDRPGRLDAEARALGARVVTSPVPIGRTWAFVRGLRSELRRGRYDVLHAHHDLVSAVYLLAATRLPLRRRIVHVHNADEQVLTPHPLKAFVLRKLLRQLCLSKADRIAAISDHTLKTFTGSSPKAKRDAVVYYGIDSTPFRRLNGTRPGLRASLSVPEGAKVLLFAGRMVAEKNPVFAVDVLVELRKMDSRVVGVFAGTGALEETARAWARAQGLGDAVRFLGWRDDVTALMDASDCFILPHPEHPLEGFGIAVVEAQLAGLPMVLSTGIADDPLLPTARYERLPLSAGATAWAAAAARLMVGPVPSRAATIAALEASPMNLDRALDCLLALYA